jgi:hypothetical protein
MARNKYDFIQDILTDKKLTPSQRERVLMLTANEIKKDKEIGLALQERVTKLEGGKSVTAKPKKIKIEKGHPVEPRNLLMFSDESPPIPEGNKVVSLSKLMGTRSKSIKKKNETSFHKGLPKYFDPKHLYHFLFEYNQDEVLKLTCHDVDSDEISTINKLCGTENYDFTKHLDLILETFDTFEKKYAPHFIKNIIRGYLKGEDYQGKPLKNGWSSDHIKIHWSSPQLLEWSKEDENLNTPPNLNEELFAERELLGFEFKTEKSIITGKSIRNFTQLVLHFKHLFHLRRNNSLKKIISHKNKAEGWDSKIDFSLHELNENIEFFTDIDKVVQGYSDIIKLIIEQNDNSPGNPEVELSFEKDKDRFLFAIHHLNSVYAKSIDDTLGRTGKTYTKLIGKINGVCNLHLIADFGKEGSGYINLWNINRPSFKRMQNQKGVKHIFEFTK